MGQTEDAFARSVREQIALNLARTPSERMLALCALLDVARAMAPSDPQARRRRLRALAARQREKEELRALFRQLIAAAGADAS